MVLTIVSENSSFTNSFLSEIYDRTKIVQINYSILQYFKNLFFKLYPEEQVITNKIENIAGDPFEINGGLNNENFKMFLNMLDETYNKIGTDKYISNLLNVLITEQLNGQIKQVFSDRYFVNIVDITKYEEFTAINNYFDAYLKNQYSESFKKEMLKSHYSNSLLKYVSENKQIQDNLNSCARSLQSNLEYYMSTSGERCSLFIDNSPIKVLIKANNPNIKLDKKLKDESLYDVVINTTDVMSKSVEKVIYNLLSKKAIDVTYGNQVLNVPNTGRLIYIPDGPLSREVIDKKYEKLFSTNASVEDKKAFLKDIQNSPGVYNKLISYLIVRAKEEESNKSKENPGAYENITISNIEAHLETVLQEAPL